MVNRGRRHGSACCSPGLRRDPIPTLSRVFFLFGLGTRQTLLGPGETRTCPRCHNTTQWSRMQEARQLTVFFIPVARWKRRRFEACGICGSTVEA